MRRASFLAVGLTFLLGCEQSGTTSAPSESETEEEASQPAEPTPAPAPERLVPSIGSVALMFGDVSAFRGDEPLTMTKGLKLAVGDRVATGEQGKVQLKLSDGSLLALGRDSEVTLVSLDLTEARRAGTVRIAIGRFWAQIAPWTRSDASLYTFETPNAVAGVRGTTLWGDTEVDAICALDGSIEVTSTKAPPKKKKRGKKSKAQTLKTGQCASMLSKGQTKVIKPSKKQVEKYLSEVLIRP